MTPIYDFLKKYAESNCLRLHMPGHKGKNMGNELSEIFRYDITEIKNADSLFEAEGIIRKSEEITTRLFNTERTVFSAGGSTLCIQAMLSAMKRENRKIFAVRNVHRAFISACVLLGIEAEWIFPEYNGSLLSGEVNIERLEEKLKGDEKKCLYITSPDYLGKTADIKNIAEVCHRNNTVLIVDNAHGCCLAFTEENNHPMALGADMCCDSAHKMLPALTGSAYLHVKNKAYAKNIKQEMGLFGSTSPSYLILASLDLCNEYIEKHIRNDLKRVISGLEKLRKNIFFRTYETGEPLHLTILPNSSGLYGYELAKILRDNNIEPEYADRQCIVLLFSPLSTDREIKRLEKVLNSVKMPRILIREPEFYMPEPRKAMTVREAGLAEFEETAVENAENRICGSINVPCPPAVPIAVCGEVISHECINIFKNYGIESVNVVK